jgi:hypothetical protein
MPSPSPAESPIGLAPAYSSPKGRPVSCSHIADGGRGRRSRSESDRWPNGGVRFASTPADCFAQIAKDMSGRCGQRAKIDPKRPGRSPLDTRGRSDHHSRGLPWGV